MDNDALTELWERQLREKLYTLYPNVEEDFIRYQQRLADAKIGEPATPEAAAQHARQFFEQQVAQQMPFVREVGSESGVTGPLTDDKLSEAQLRAIRQKTQDTLQAFEARLQNASGTMSTAKRRFAEAFLGMAKRHTDLMENRLTDTDKVTEADLGDVAEQMASDLRDLTRRLRQERQDDAPPD